jgi:hypothetical protein
MNEFGWMKRRETLGRCKISENEDDVIRHLKMKEGVPLTPAKQPEVVQDENN